MDEILELTPSDKAYLLFDGRVLYIFRSNTDEVLMPARGITDITVSSGWTGMINFKNRYAPNYALDYDKERMPEIEAFIAKVLAAVRGG